jgi:hypothetical protein
MWIQEVLSEMMSRKVAGDEKGCGREIEREGPK